MKIFIATNTKTFVICVVALKISNDIAILSRSNIEFSSKDDDVVNRVNQLLDPDESNASVILRSTAEQPDMQQQPVLLVENSVERRHVHKNIISWLQRKARSIYETMPTPTFSKKQLTVDNAVLKKLDELTKK